MTPTMTRQHFKLIADVVRNFLPSDALDQVTWEETREELAYMFAAELATTNPNFNRARFLKACGVVED